MLGANGLPLLTECHQLLYFALMECVTLYRFAPLRSFSSAH